MLSLIYSFLLVASFAILEGKVSSQDFKGLSSDIFKTGSCKDCDN